METKKFDLLRDIVWEDFYQTPILSLIVSNLLVLLWALYQRWDVLSVMWIYWIQSVSIGFFWFLTIMFHRQLYGNVNFVSSRGIPEQLGPAFRMPVAVFFLFHYGFFHFGYFAFLSGGHFFLKNQTRISTKSLIFFGGIFVVSQLFSFAREFKELINKPASVNRFMMFPYARILPLHFAIILGGIFGDVLHKSEPMTGPAVLLIFLLLKTGADAVMEIRQRKGFLDPAAVKLDPLSLPAILQTEQGDVLAMPNGKIVELVGNIELEERVKAIFKFPPEIQAEVLEKIVKKYSEPAPAKSAREVCRCDRVSILEGPEAKRYADGHLLFIQTCDDGSDEYRCPKTHQRWTMLNNTLRKVEAKYK